NGTASVASAIDCFSSNPAQYQKLRENPSLVPAAVEEVLRWESPSQLANRRFPDDVVVADVTIPAGQRASLLGASANHDETVFVDPEDFNIDRRPNNHLVFGAGKRYCAGSQLTRTLLRVAISKMLSYWESVPAVDSPVWRRTFFHRRAIALPMEFR